MSAQQRQLEALQQLMLQQQGKTLVEFKAGKLKLAGTTVTADPRRGTVSVKESAADGMTRLQWKTRPGGKREEDLLIVPNDVTVEKIPECKTGRVLLVRMRSSARKLFFWIQEPEEKKDTEIIEKLTKAFSGASSGAGGMSGGIPGLGGASAGAGGGDMQQAIQQFLMQQNMSTDQPSTTSTGGGAAEQMAAQQFRQMQATSLTNILDQKKMILEALNEKSRESLYEYLPKGQQDSKGFEACLHSPQLQQGAARLTRVLNSAQYGNLVTSFGLRNNGELGCGAFISAIEEKFAPKEEGKLTEERKEENKDDPMDTSN